MKIEINTVLCNWQWISVGRDFEVCIFAGRRFAAWKVCCQVECVFISTVTQKPGAAFQNAWRSEFGGWVQRLWNCHLFHCVLNMTKTWVLAFFSLIYLSFSNHADDFTCLPFSFGHGLPRVLQRNLCLLQLWVRLLWKEFFLPYALKDHQDTV